jgi:hypothetical protein
MLAVLVDRLLPVCVVRSVTCPRQSHCPGSDVRRGQAQIGQYCPPGHSPAHVDLEPL